MKHIRLFLLLALLATIGMVFGQNPALSFDGSGDYVHVAGMTRTATSYTIEAWIYPTQMTGGSTTQQQFGFTVFGSTTTAAIYPVLLSIRNGEFMVWSYETTSPAISNFRQSSGAGIVLNQWQHIAITATRGGNTTVYLDGAAVLSYNNDGEGAAWAGQFTMGTVRPGNDGYFIGMIDEVRIWDSVRTPAELDANKYELNAPYPADLFAYFKIDEGSGTTTADSKGALTGNIVNATWGEGPETLPIELSSFTAIPNAQYFVELHWITQSETNVAGFRVYRSETPYLENAVMFNTFVPAHNTSSTQVYTYVDEEIFASGTYYYWLENVDMTGSTQFHGPVIATVTYGEPSTPPAIPATANGIQKIFPNPFNPTTSIQYSVVEEAAVRINVYNLRGQLISKVFDGSMAPGTHTATWNGVADNGSELSSGIYTVTVKIGNETHIQRVVLSK